MKKQTERAVVFGDLHIPFWDLRAVSLLFNFLKWFKPDVIFLNGDILDCWEISKFIRPLSIKVRMKDELKKGRDFLAQLRKENPQSKIIYIFGNHEYRFERFLALNAPQLDGLEGMTLEEQLHLPQLNIKAINSHQRENFYRYGNLLIAHFNKVNKHAGYTAKNLVEEKGMSLIQNHTHRIGSSLKRDYKDIKGGWEIGCLCNLNPPYTSMPNWQLGFATVHTDRKTNFFMTSQVVIVNHHIIYGDKTFRG